MAGTFVETYNTWGSVKELYWRITSAAGGSADKSADVPINGRITTLIIEPHATDVPTNLYDIIIDDDWGLDILDGQGANLVNTTTYIFCPNAGIGTKKIDYLMCNSKLHVALANAGNAKTVSVFVRWR